MKIDQSGRQLTQFEREVIEKHLQGDHASLRILRKQLCSCEVTSRRNTGYGLYSDLQVDRSAVGPARLVSRNCARNVLAQVPGQDLGFVLWFADGYLDCLEGFSYDVGSWPDEVSEYSLSFLSHPSEDGLWLPDV